MNLSLSDLFGESSSQDINNLVIKKSGLPKLSVSSNNTSESLLVGILLKSMENFTGVLTDNYGNIIKDNNDNFIDYDNSILYEYLLVSVFNRFLDVKNDKKVFVVNLLVQGFKDYANTEFS
jgi:hypothetical protein